MYNKIKTFLSRSPIAYAKLPAMFRVILIPTLANLVILLVSPYLTNTSYKDWWYWLLVWAAVTLLNSVLTYFNTVTVERNSTDYNTMYNLLKKIDSITKSKKDTLKKRLELSKKNSDKFLLKDARKFLHHDLLLKTINQKVYEWLVHFLDLHEKMNVGYDQTNLTFCMLRPNKDGYFVSVNLETTHGNMDDNPYDTQIKINDKNSVAGILWSKTLKKKCVYVKNVDALNNPINYKKYDKNDDTKSIICCRLDNPLTNEPLAIWSVHSDQNDTFSDKRGSYAEIEKMFDSMSLRVELETVYEDYLKRIDEQLNN